jgi:hypothetical protein
MANPEQLQILQQGVEAWTKWRTDDMWVTRPDLRTADLRESHLLRLARLPG